MCLPIESEEYDDELDVGWPDEMEDSSECGQYFQGDMDLDEDQLAEIFAVRIVLRNESYKWKNALVPFQLSSDHDVNFAERILKAMKEIETVWPSAVGGQ